MTKFERLMYFAANKKLRQDALMLAEFNDKAIENAIKESEEIRNGKPVYFNGFINKLIDSNGIKG